MNDNNVITKERLNNYRLLQIKIQKQKETLGLFDAKITKPAGIKFDDTPKRKPQKDIMLNLITKKIELENYIKELEKQERKEYKIINRAINQLENPYYQLILQLRYLYLFPWDKINSYLNSTNEDFDIEKNGKYERRMFRTHGLAINALFKMTSV